MKVKTEIPEELSDEVAQVSGTVMDADIENESFMEENLLDNPRFQQNISRIFEILTKKVVFKLKSKDYTGISPVGSVCKMFFAGVILSDRFQ